MLRFFIKRPRFAMVISLVITLVGLAAFKLIPVEQLPDVTPPVINVSAVYPGASAEDIVQSIAAPIEAEVNGVENMLYMESVSSNSGSYQLNITFAQGTDPNMAAVEVQNRVAQVTSRLPAEVLDQGVGVRARSSNILMGISVYSSDGSRDQLFLSNYTAQHIQDAVTRITGVSDAQLIGARDYAIRIWLDVSRMNALDITADDIISSLREQHVLAAAGMVGGPPSSDTQGHSLAIVSQGRFMTPEEFSGLIVRSSPNGAFVRLRDVARVELGAASYEMSASLNSHQGVFLAVYPTPGANALQVSQSVRAEVERLSENFPSGMNHSINYDSTTFISASMYEVFFSLSLTLIVVLAVIYAFLQNAKAILIVALILPVSLIGTFAVLYLAGYSANSLTLFAIILALTMVVDDAIVVVENVERIMEENPHMGAAEATGKTLGEISGPVIATTVVLLAVFVPVAALPGITGSLFRQFAVTISAAMCFSSLSALTLSPALCAVLFRQGRKGNQPGIFIVFNRTLDKLRDAYVAVVRMVSSSPLYAVGGLLAAALAVWAGLTFLPQSFLPAEDQGYLFVNIQLPEGASLNRTERVAEKVERVLLEEDGIEHVIFINGFGILNSIPDTNTGFAIAILKPWGERPHADEILARLQTKLASIPSALIMALNPPAIAGLGSASGFDLRLQATRGQSVQEMARVSRAAILAANQEPHLQNVFTTFSASVPQLELTVNRDRAALLGLAPSRVFSSLQAGFGGITVGDFSKNGREYRVLLQNDAQDRSRREQVLETKIRNTDGNLVRLRAIASVSPTVGAPFIQRFNQFPSVAVIGSAAEGVSSGQALAVLENTLQKTLPDGYAHAWSGMSYQEKAVGSQVVFIYLAAMLFAYLFLVAQYESWMIPLAVMLSVSFALAGALAGLWIAGYSNDIYVRIGLIMLIGIAAKNAILIVEFSRQRRQEGASVEQAALEGARTRFRAVMMTAVSFIFGVMPLMLATGAGAAGRRIIGTTVFSGMLFATLVGILFIPALYKWLQHIGEKRPRASDS